VTIGAELAVTIPIAAGHSAVKLMQKADKKIGLADLMGIITKTVIHVNDE
jgi:hypothetical protein